jgi:hypothetical protein
MDKLKVIEDLKALLEKLRPLFDVVEVLEKIGSLEQAGSDALAGKVKAYAELNDVKLMKVEKENEIVDADSKLIKVYEDIKRVQEAGQLKIKEMQEQFSKAMVEEEEKLAEFRKKASDEVSKQMKAIELYKAALAASEEELKASQAKVEEVKASLAAFIKG